MGRGFPIGASGNSPSAMYQGSKNGPGAPGVIDRAGGIRDGQVTVATVAVKLPAEPLEFRRWLLIQNLGAGDLYIGGPTVRVGTGTKIASGDSFEWPVRESELYGISATSCDVRILELS